MEYRYYDILGGSPLLVLLGGKWEQNYGKGADFLHFHNHMEIGYCYKGEGILTIKDKDYNFGGGMFSVIPKNIPHNTKSEGESYSKWEYIFLDVDGFITEAFKKNVIQQKEFLERINGYPHFGRTAERPEIAVLIRQIMDTMREHKEFYMEEVRGLILALLMEIARWNSETREHDKKSQVQKVGNTLILDSLDYININYQRQIKVEELARVCHISETHFRRLFTEFMKMTPVEYINKVRIQRACNDLKNTNLSVGDIAVKNGFSDLSTFNRNFKKYSNLSPKQWRNQLDIYERKSIEYDIRIQEGW